MAIIDALDPKITCFQVLKQMSTCSHKDGKPSEISQNYSSPSSKSELAKMNVH